jgi:hypothetical protein
VTTQEINDQFNITVTPSGNNIGAPMYEILFVKKPQPTSEGPRLMNAFGKSMRFIVQKHEVGELGILNATPSGIAESPKDFLEAAEIALNEYIAAHAATDTQAPE